MRTIETRILSLLLALMMAFSCAAPAFATELPQPQPGSGVSDGELPGEAEPTPEPEPSSKEEQTITGLTDCYSMLCGDTLQLTPVANTPLSYKSSDKSIVTVTKAGLLKAVGTGSAVITISAAESAVYQPAARAMTVIVSRNSQSITIPKTEYSCLFKKGFTFSLNAKSDGGALTYKSSNPKVVTVSSKGVCTAVGAGSAVITITAAASASCSAVSKNVTVCFYTTPKQLSYSSSYKNSKYYRALTALRLTGNPRSDLISIANSQLGYHEGRSSSQLGGNGSGDGNCTEYGRYYGYTRAPWCAMFVSWVAREGGISTSVIPRYAAVSDYTSWFRSRGRLHYWNSVRKKQYVPQKGDIIIYSDYKSGSTHHIGYVTGSSYTSSKITINTVEGNTIEEVRTRKMTLSRTSSGWINGHYIYAIATPKY